MKVKSLSCVWLFVTLWTVAYQAPPTLGFSRQEYWSGLPFPSPGDLPDPEIEPRSPTLPVDTLPSEPPGKPQFCSVVSDSLWPHRLYSSWNFPGQNTGVGSLSLLQGIFPTQGSNPGLTQCRQLLYQLSHQRSPGILEWVAYPFSRDLPDPGVEPGSPALQVDSLPTELSGKPTLISNLLFELLKRIFMAPLINSSLE